jgi:hypothetical protein
MRKSERGQKQERGRAEDEEIGCADHMRQDSLACGPGIRQYRLDYDERDDRDYGRG